MKEQNKPLGRLARIIMANKWLRKAYMGFLWLLLKLSLPVVRQTRTMAAASAARAARGETAGIFPILPPFPEAIAWVEYVKVYQRLQLSTANRHYAKVQATLVRDLVLKFLPKGLKDSAKKAKKKRMKREKRVRQREKKAAKVMEKQRKKEEKRQKKAEKKQDKLRAKEEKIQMKKEAKRRKREEKKDQKRREEEAKFQRKEDAKRRKQEQKEYQQRQREEEKLLMKGEAKRRKQEREEDEKRGRKEAKQQKKMQKKEEKKKGRSGSGGGDGQASLVEIRTVIPRDSTSTSLVPIELHMQNGNPTFSLLQSRENMTASVLTIIGLILGIAGSIALAVLSPAGVSIAVVAILIFLAVLQVVLDIDVQ